LTSSTYKGRIKAATLTANRTYTLPDASGVVALETEWTELATLTTTAENAMSNDLSITIPTCKEICMVSNYSMEYNAYYFMYSNVFPYPAIPTGYNVYLRQYGRYSEGDIIFTVCIKDGVIKGLQTGKYKGTFSVYYR
jgi:hypothetical protein